MKTSMQELKDKIQHAIEELNGELNDYKAGYKQCLINIQNDIDFQMLQMEKEQRGYSEEDVIKIVEKSRETGLTAEYLLLTFKQQEQINKE
jgi:hypothetical protein